ncbi:MAG: shikimate kinase [Cyclobacteriaceae bacterium]
MTSRKIFLVGLPACGKTTFAKKLSERIDSTFLDLDDEIAKSSGQSIGQLFEDKGEEYFRKIEKEQLVNVANTNDEFVLACGGGTPCFYENMDFMNQSGITIYINTPLDEIRERLVEDRSRPLMKKFDLSELQTKRKAWYQQAQHTVTGYQELENLFN